MDAHVEKPPVTTGLANIHKVKVLWHDCDPAGIIFYANYYRWMDDASYYLFVKAGLAWESLMTEYGVPGVPLVSAHADFLIPAAFGNELTVESHISGMGRSSFTVSHRFRLDKGIAAEGWEKRVWCKVDPDDPTSISAIPIPLEIRTALGMERSGAG